MGFWQRDPEGPENNCCIRSSKNLPLKQVYIIDLNPWLSRQWNGGGMVPIHNSYRHFRRVIVTQHLKSFCIEHRVALTGAMHNFDGCCRFAPKPNPSPFSDRVLDPEAYPIPKQCVPCLQRDWLRGPARPCCQQGLLAAPLCPPACTLGRAVSGPVLLQTTFRVRTGGGVSTTCPCPITLYPLHEVHACTIVSDWR